jgi:hypothetical protein
VALEEKRLALAVLEMLAVSPGVNRTLEADMADRVRKE